MIRGKYQNLFLIFILSMFNFNYKEFNPDVGGFINHDFQVYFLLLLFVPYKFFFLFFYAELFKWKIRSIFRKASKKKILFGTFVIYPVDPGFCCWKTQKLVSTGILRVYVHSGDFHIHHKIIPLF